MIVHYHLEITTALTSWQLRSGDRRRYDEYRSETMARMLDGAGIAAAIKEEVKAQVRDLAAQGVRPGLAAVLVGHVPASEIYVRSKVQACAELGLASDLITPPDTVSTDE